MPYNSTRILSSASRPFLSASRPAALRTALPSVQARFQGGVGKPWEGSWGQKHTTHRVKEEGDTTDPQTIGASRSMKEREENFGSGVSQSGAATERGGKKNEKETKKEHPKAPEPIIGMNDERAQKGVP